MARYTIYSIPAAKKHCVPILDTQDMKPSDLSLLFPMTGVCTINNTRIWLQLL
jgi:hypothetical protein